MCNTHFDVVFFTVVSAVLMTGVSEGLRNPSGLSRCPRQLELCFAIFRAWILTEDSSGGAEHLAGFRNQCLIMSTLAATQVV